LTRVTAYKCDACALMIDGEVYAATVTLPTGKYAADLCEKCAHDVFKTATFQLKSRPKQKARATRPTAVPA
jgi:hypothetical protein